jgi:hypothetical protein
MIGKSNPIRESEYEQKVSRAADRFWGMFQFTENGRPKSTLLLYSFCLCWVFLAIYGAAFALLIDPLDALVSGAPVLVVNLVEALVPTVVSTAVCALSWFLSKTEKRLMPAAYLWMLLLALACFITLLILLRDERDAQALVLQFFAMFVLAPVLLGGGLSMFLYYRHWKKRPAAPPAEPWKRQ